MTHTDYFLVRTNSDPMQRRKSLKMPLAGNPNHFCPFPEGAKSIAMKHTNFGEHR